MLDLPRRILVPVDYGAPSQTALERAYVYASALGAELEVLYVWPAPYAEVPIDHAETVNSGHNLFELTREQCGQQLEAYVATAGRAFPLVSVRRIVVSGDPREQIVHHAQTSGCDWIIIGSHHRKAPVRWLLGSVAEYVVRHAPCPVLVVPPGPQVP